MRHSTRLGCQVGSGLAVGRGTVSGQRDLGHSCPGSFRFSEPHLPLLSFQPWPSQTSTASQWLMHSALPASFRFPAQVV